MRRNKSKLDIFQDIRGQFLILVSLGIAIIMVCLSLAIANTTVSSLNFPKTRFRETAIQIYMNFRQTLGIALAEVTKELSNRGCTRLSEYSAAADKGHEVLTKWLEAMHNRYASLGLNLNISEPIFECDWSSTKGYSRAKANITINILSYGLYNLRGAVTVELNLNTRTNVTFELKDEFNAPVTGLSINSINITGALEINQLIYNDGIYIVNYTLIDNPPNVRRIILQGPNSIIVGAIIPQTNDTAGPTVTVENIETKYFGDGTKIIVVYAAVKDINGSSNIASVECYVNNLQNITMVPEDGAFDSPAEKVFARINVTGKVVGVDVTSISIRGKDTAGNYGDFVNVTLQGVHVKEMKITKSIEGRRGNDRIRITVNVLVVNQNKIPVDNVNVFGIWILRNRQGREIQRTEVSGRTINGKATFEYILPANTRGTCTFTIRSLGQHHQGIWYLHDPQLDITREVSVTLP